MPDTPHTASPDPLPRLRGWLSFVHDLVDTTTHIVSEGIESGARIGLRVTDAIAPIAAPARGIDGVRRISTQGVLTSVRVINRAVELLIGVGLDALPAGSALAAPIPLRSSAVFEAAWIEDAALGVVNGILGDRLGATTAALDLGMGLRHGDAYLPPAPSARSDRPTIVVLIHGLATTEWSWCLGAEAYHGDAGATFGTLLAGASGLEPVYARYNTGRPIAANGARLAASLEGLFKAWDPARIVLLGHSMGGLVAQAACEAGARMGHGWPARITDVVSLATPHQGSPLAALAEAATQGFDAVDLPTTRVLARILDLRSAGIRDLRAGTLRAEAGAGATPHPEASLLPHVRYAFLSATLTKDPRFAGILGDLLVPVTSASGPKGAHATWPIVNRTFGGVLHHQIQCHPEVFALVKAILDPDPEALEARLDGEDRDSGGDGDRGGDG